MSKWKKGERYAAAYGVATVVRVWDDGKGAEFRIEILDREAARLGWRQGDKFIAHQDDQVIPSPKTWKHVAKPSPEERERERQRLIEIARRRLKM
jgi:hypothetical protein